MQNQNKAAMPRLEATQPAPVRRLTSAARRSLAGAGAGAGATAVTSAAGRAPADRPARAAPTEGRLRAGSRKADGSTGTGAELAWRRDTCREGEAVWSGAGETACYVF